MRKLWNVAEQREPRSPRGVLGNCGLLRNVPQLRVKQGAEGFENFAELTEGLC
jgi:hypothetical protein